MEKSNKVEAKCSKFQSCLIKKKFIEIRPKRNVCKKGQLSQLTEIRVVFLLIGLILYEAGTCLFREKMPVFCDSNLNKRQASLYRLFKVYKVLGSKSEH